MSGRWVIIYGRDLINWVILGIKVADCDEDGGEKLLSSVELVFVLLNLVVPFLHFVLGSFR
jgi:hypothetical protein